MPIFIVATKDGKIVVESAEPTADALADSARTRGHFGGDEIVSATGRDTMGHKNPIAIPYHAIIAIRAKR